MESVYRMTRRIPRGKVLSYGDIARILHKPGSSRAVGNALGQNPQLIVMPCHRVVRSDGSLGGYAGGVRKKKALLLREGVAFCGEKVDLKKSRWILK